MLYHLEADDDVSWGVESVLSVFILYPFAFIL
jgi:hypothetical protein